MSDFPPAPSIATSRRLGPLLGEHTAGRDNNVLPIRFLAAVTVILFHCYALTGHWNEEPLHAAFPPMNFGTLGVYVFFVLSGFLVTQSWLAHPAVGPYAAARVLRIYPALIAATLFTIALAGWSSTLPWREYLTSPVTWRYLVRTASAFDVVDRLPGVFPDNPFRVAANGSLWTLPVELRLYVALGLAGVAGLLGKPRAWVAAGLVLVAAALAWPDHVPLDPNTHVSRLAALLFLLGSLACVWQRHVPLSLPAATLAVVLPLVDASGLARDGPLFALLLAYAVIVAAYHPALRIRRLARMPDYSYGLYVYAFPIQQSIIRLLPDIAPPLLFGLALAATLAVAAVSWHTIEAPALALKSRFRPSRPTRP